MTASPPPALRCRGISVTYGEVTALAEVGLDLEPGRIHAFVGQNGAGKTTFARVAAGLVRPDAGALSIHGRELRFGRVAEARAAGVELVHQSFALPPSFTVAEAIEFGAGGGIGLFTRRRLLRRWGAHLRALDLDVDPRRRIRDLPIETQQGVEIARALVTEARVLILDEPTAVLPPPGIESLFRRLRGLKARGVTVVLILHKLREVFAVADTVSVLRGGRLVAGPVARERLEPAAVAEMIIGPAGAGALRQADRQALVGTAAGASGPGALRKSDPFPATHTGPSPRFRSVRRRIRGHASSSRSDGVERSERAAASPEAGTRLAGTHGPPPPPSDSQAGEVSGPGVEHTFPPQLPGREAVLRLTGVRTGGDAEGPALDALSFRVGPGEIVGVAGVEGNGQRTLVRVVAGLAAVTGGEVRLGGTAVTASGLARRRSLGLRIIPFDRNVEGLSLTSGLWQNWSAGALLQRPLLAPIRPSRLRDRCARALAAWDVHFASPSQPAGSLSGGNAQKVILAREIDDEARLVVAAQPTRGLDIRATAFVWQALRSARERGCGVLLISSDLDELFDVADRVLVMLSGRIVAEHLPPYDLAAVGRAMTGLAASESVGESAGATAGGP